MYVCMWYVCMCVCVRVCVVIVEAILGMDGQQWVEWKLMKVVSGYFEIPKMPPHPVSYFRKSVPGTTNWLSARNKQRGLPSQSTCTRPLGAVSETVGWTTKM
eukprot:gb/GECG01011509.1/.p1 GENE.gb/GECG01011509.1/~~gb/GECG01011509.1/.p1  ORF type:complete len:102 (+),score=9.89 gb/GECG01011509.1/:1-306(+)